MHLNLDMARKGHTESQNAEVGNKNSADADDRGLMEAKEKTTARTHQTDKRFRTGKTNKKS